MAGTGGFNHDDAGVVIYGDYPNRDAGEWLAHHAGVSQRI
jgi:hypothetical protein